MRMWKEMLVRASMETRLLELLGSGSVQERLERPRSAGRVARVVFAAWCADREFYFSAGGGSADAAARERIGLGCLTKLLTAELVWDACLAGDLTLDEEVRDRLRCRSAALAGITVRHLLEHSHGLDDSLLLRAPVASSGRIDTERLIEQLGAVPPLAAPGELYSYSHAGAWLAAAVLERCHDAPYGALLANRCSPALAPHARPVCPAVGAGLRVTAAQLLHFLRASIEQWPQASGGGVSLPGWSPLEQGIERGWKRHGAGVFGHQSVLPGAASLVRIVPSQRLALLVASAAEPAAVVAARLIGAELPELVGVQPLPSAAIDSPSRSYAGCYRSAARCAIVGHARGALHVHAMETGGARSPARISLRPAGADSFLAAGHCAGPFAFVQFVRPQKSGFRFLWNGRTVLRRI